jgi:hypothetical protein
MKKLISQFKKSHSFKSLPKHENFSFAVVIGTIMLGASCQLARKTDEEAASPKIPDSYLNVMPPIAPATLTDAEAKERFDLVYKINGEDFPVGQVFNPECDQPVAAVLNLEVITHSAFGNHRTAFAIRGDDKSETVRATIDETAMGFPSSLPIKDRVNTLVCASKEVGKTTAEITTESFDQIREFLESVGPDCEQITAKKMGWFCKVASVDPESAKQELIGVRTAMIRKWSRQPYLLARRLAVGIQIANALQSDRVEKSLDTFCNIIKDNLPQEVPIVMTSKKWQNALCTKESEFRVEAAMFGLAKTINEIDFMRQLFEATSKLGSLTIRVPKDVSPSGQFFVQLKPQADVNGNLASASLKLWKTDGTAEEPQRPCWHPLFMETPQLMEIAINLAMAGDSTRALCDRAKPSIASEQYLESYLADSITSETEFVVSNGRAKVLRLPTGEYSYTVHALPENPDEWDDASLTATPATGLIEWTVKKPRAIISSWGVQPPPTL